MTFAVPNAYETPDEEGWRDKLPALPESMDVDLTQMPMNEMHEGASILELPNGGIEIDFEPGDAGRGGSGGPGSGMPEEGGFGDNLAEGMSETELSQIAAQVEEWVKADIDSRTEWHQRLADSLVLLGVTFEPEDKIRGAFKLTHKVNHPAIAEAAVQFQARASAELLPATGPAKGLVLGDKTEELEQQAQRVADYENYQLMVEDKEFFPETEKLLFTLSLNGSQFKKIYRDHLEDRNVSRWVRGEDFIVPYGATTLMGAPRYTHQQVIERNDMKKLQQGFYRKVALMNPAEGPTRDQRVEEQKDRAQGQQDAGKYQLDEIPHTVWECACNLDLKGFEDVGEDGQPTGIGLPYLVTVEKDSRTVLSIYRNWKETDPLRKKRVNFVHYPMLPGEGFYSYGYLHFLGGAGHAATGLLRTILLGAAFASLNGGFKSKDAALPSNIELEYGVWKDTQLSAEELSKCFYTPPFKGPSEADFKLLGLIQEAIQRFTSTTESMVGDANNTGPVGTTVALIEQGSKVFSGIHRRLHYAQGEELRLLAELNGEHIPEEGYPYAIAGASKQVFAADFDDRVDVVPVSDPNIFSSTQRIAIAQTLVQRSSEAPDMYDRRKVEKRFLEAMRVPDPDDVLTDPTKVERHDPVTENALLLMSQPVKVFPDQHHGAHITLHMDQLDRLTAEQSPLLKQVAPAHIAHVAEHMAVSYKLQMQQAIGMQLPDGEQEQPMDPRMENMIAERAAQVVMQMPQPGMGGEQQAGLEQQAQALQQQAAELEQERQAVAAEADANKQEKMRMEFAKREGALREQMATMKQQAQGKDVAANVKALIDEGVRRVEAALGKGKQ